MIGSLKHGKNSALAVPMIPRISISDISIESSHASNYTFVKPSIQIIFTAQFSLSLEDRVH